jgi:hypothetical protein
MSLAAMNQPKKPHHRRSRMQPMGSSAEVGSEVEVGMEPPNLMMRRPQGNKAARIDKQKTQSILNGIFLRAHAKASTEIMATAAASKEG